MIEILGDDITVVKSRFIVLDSVAFRQTGMQGLNRIAEKRFAKRAPLFDTLCSIPIHPRPSL